MLAQPSSAGKPSDGGRVPTPETAVKGAAAPGWLAPAPADALPAWGKPKDGLRIGIVKAGTAPGGSGQAHLPELPAGNGRMQLSVALENIGKDDLVLNLGIMLANGKKQLPYAVHLILTDAAKKTRVLHLHLKMPGIAGRVDRGGRGDLGRLAEHAAALGRCRQGEVGSQPSQRLSAIPQARSGSIPQAGAQPVLASQMASNRL